MKYWKHLKDHSTDARQNFAGFEDVLGHLVGWKIDHILCILKTIKNEDTAYAALLQNSSIFVKKSD